MMDGMLPANAPALLPITTPRLLLREYHPSDRIALEQLHSSGDSQCCQDSRALITPPFHHHIAQPASGLHNTPRSTYALVIELYAARQVIGACGLSINHANRSEAELCYAITPRFQGYGYASEAASALLAFGFDELQLRRIFGMCSSSDIGSGRVMEKIGMVLEGRLNEHARGENHWRERLLYGMIDRDWSARGLRARYV